MTLSLRLACATGIFVSTAAIAADMLPLNKGVYVPAGRACTGAANSDIVNYLGANSAIGVAQATCTIKKLSRKGNTFTLTDECRDLQSGDVIEGGPTVLTISNRSNFRMNGTAYRYCGTKVPF